MTKFTSLTLVEIAAEALLYEVVQPVLEGFEADGVDNLVDKSKLEQQPCLVEADAALAHIEEGCIVELADGAAMGALDIVGIDFEHGLGVHAGGTRGAEVLVGFLRGGLLGSVAHEHASGKGSHSVVVEHILVELVAGAVGHLVVYERIVVHALCLVGDDASVAAALGSLASEGEVEAVDGGAVVEGDDIVVDAAVGLLLDKDVAGAGVAYVGLFHAVEVEAGVVAHVCLDDLGGEEAAVVGCVVAEEEPCLGALLYDDEHAAVDHEVDIGAQDVDNLYGAVHAHIAGHVDEESVLGEHGVERHEGVGSGLGEASVVGLYELGLGGCHPAEAVDDDSLGQMGLGQLAGVEAVVDHEVERGAEIGHIAAEGVVGVDGDVKAVEVEPVVGLEELGHVGILISLYLARGEAHTPEVGEGLLAQCVHHRRRVGVNDTRALGIEIDILLFAVHIYIYNKVVGEAYSSASALIQS